MTGVLWSLFLLGWADECNRVGTVEEVAACGASCRKLGLIVDPRVCAQQAAQHPRGRYKYGDLCYDCRELEYIMNRFQ